MRFIFILTLSTPLITFAQSSQPVAITSDNDSIYFTVDGKTSAIANEDMATYYLEEGLAAAVEGDYVSAENKFRVGLLYNPKNDQLLYNLGLAEYYQEQYEDAINTFDIAADVDPENPDIYNQRGLAKAMLGRYSAAEVDFLILLKYAPDHALGNFNYGILKLQQGDTAGACSYLHKADSLGYENAPAVISTYCGMEGE